MSKRSSDIRDLVSLNGAVVALCALLAGCGGTQVQVPGRPSNQTRVVCWGDSMTAGYEGVSDQGAYPTLLQQDTGDMVINMGVGGQTSTQIGVRQGGIPTYVTVNGGLIPSDGSGVTVTFTQGYEPLTSPNGSIQGSILGVEGKITLSGFLPQGIFTFTPLLAPGQPVSATGKPQFIPDQPYKSYLPVFWEGRNNLLQITTGPWGTQQILSDIAAQVATVPAGTNYLVLSVLNENDAAERNNGVYYPNLVELNSALSSTYGAYYLDVRSILVGSYNPSSPVDVTDHGYDMPPTSLEAISAQGTLASAIGASDLTFSVNVTSGTLRPFQILVIDQESIQILEVNGSTVTTALRGYGGTVTSHAAGATVTEHDPTHLNKDGYTIVAKAVAAKLAAQ